MSPPKWPIVLTPGLMAHINLYPQLPLLYLMNPKAACSSVKQSLWQHHDRINGIQSYPGNPHQARERAPFRYAAAPASIYPEFLTDLGNAVAFTIVRNPYARVLSAYLDKVKRSDREKLVWGHFSQSFGLDINARPSFLKVLKLLRSENPYLLDRHFAPQWVNVLADLMPLNKIFYVEEFNDLRLFMKEYGIETTIFDLHATNAAELLKTYYGPAEIEEVQQIYARDFDLFGYSRDIQRAGPTEPVVFSHPVVSALEDAIVLFAPAPRAEKETRLGRIAEILPSIDLHYLRYATIGMSFEEKLRAASEVSEKGSTNWRYASELGADLARDGALRVAMPVLKTARAIQKNQRRAVSGSNPEGPEQQPDLERRGSRSPFARLAFRSGLAGRPKA